MGLVAVEIATCLVRWAGDAGGGAGCGRGWMGPAVSVETVAAAVCRRGGKPSLFPRCGGSASWRVTKERCYSTVQCGGSR
jgi:hypothetical protein